MPEQSTPPRKFRNTCTNCANAKVKCDTTRPECGRCQERALSCSYAPSNRYGRRPASSINTPHWNATNVLSNPPIDLCGNPFMYYPTFAQSEVNYSSSQVGDICGAPRDTSVDHIQYQPQVFPAGNSEWYLHNLGLTSPPVIYEREPQSSELQITSQPLSPPSSLFTYSLPSEPEDPLEDSCTCLSRAANILLEVRGSNNADLTGFSVTEGGSMIDNSRNAELRIGDVIFTNRRILGQVTNILDCHCVGGDYQALMIIYMIWFHLIANYAAAVSMATGPINRDSHNRLVGSVQVLQGELRQLSVLIDKPFPLLKEARTGSRSAVIGVSVSVFKQLQGDLAQHVHHVSTRADQILQHLST
jgi:hypothetical protein